MLRGLAPHSLCRQTLSRIVSDGRKGNRGLSYFKQITVLGHNYMSIQRKAPSFTKGNKFQVCLEAGTSFLM